MNIGKQTGLEKKYLTVEGEPAKSGGGRRTLQAVRLLVLGVVCCGSSPAWAQRINLAASPATQSVAASTQFEVDLTYSTTAPARHPLPGAQVRVFFDSSKVTFSGFSNQVRATSLTQPPAVSADTGNLDSDTDTDMLVGMAWLHSNEASEFPWPGVFPSTAANNVVTLVTLEFTTANDFRADAEISMTLVGLAEGLTQRITNATITPDLPTVTGVEVRYVGGFREAASNDGMMDGSIVVTAYNTTLASTLTHGTHVTVSNVPSNLTPVLARTAPSIVTVTLTGSAGSHASANDVDDLTITFADDAFTGHTAAEVTGSTKTDGTIMFDDPSTITYMGGSYTETALNNGGVGLMGALNVTLEGDTFAVNLPVPDAVAFTNVPTGLTPEVDRLSPTTARVRFTGMAEDHESSDNVNNVSLAFQDDAFANEAASGITGSTYSTISIEFDDPATLTFDRGTDFVEATALDGSVDGMITATLTGDTFVTGLSASDVTFTNVPDSLVGAVTRTSDTVATITLTGTADAHAPSNSVTNMSITFKDTAFESGALPATPSLSDIEIAFAASRLVFSPAEDHFTEAAANDGSVTGSIVATLTGDAFATGLAVAHLTFANVPGGLTGAVDRTSATVATITLTGTANDHEASHSIENLSVTFAAAAFASGDASTPASYTAGDVNFNDAASLAITTPTGTGFTEAAANDGSVTGSIVATLSNGTFATSLTSPTHVTFANVPEGLMPEITRTSDTVVTVTLSGTADAHGSGADVNNLTITFVAAAFATGGTPSGLSKNDITVTFASSTLAFNNSDSNDPPHFVEADANDGSVTGSIVATLNGDTFVSPIAGVAVTNVPNGLMSEVTRTSPTVVTVTLTGMAADHDSSENVNNLTVTFGSTAFTNAEVSTPASFAMGRIEYDDPELTVAASDDFAGQADGSVAGSIVATLSGDAFASTITLGTHVTVGGLGDLTGLTAEVARTSDTVVTVTVTGMAEADPLPTDDQTLTVGFVATAFAGGSHPPTLNGEEYTGATDDFETTFNFITVTPEDHRTLAHEQRIERLAAVTAQSSAALATSVVHKRRAAAPGGRSLRLAGYDVGGLLERWEESSDALELLEARDDARDEEEPTYRSGAIEIDLTPQALLRNSSFELSLDDRGTGLTFWGQGGLVWQDGDPEVGANEARRLLDYDGQSYAFHVGTDLRLSESLLLGIAVGYERNDVDFNERAEEVPALSDGEVTGWLLGVTPYLSWDLSPTVSVWGLAGYGAGDLSIEGRETGGGEMPFDIDTEQSQWMAAGGVSGTAEWGEGGSAILSLQGRTVHRDIDGQQVDENDESLGRLPSLTAESHRIGAELEVGYRYGLQADGSMRPFATVQARHDSGDGADGVAYDVGGGLEASWPSRGMSMRIEGRTQLNDREDNEHQLSGSVDYNARSDGRGLSLSLAPRWLASGTSDDRMSWGGELGYGMSSWRGQGLLRPYLQMSTDGRETRYTGGARLSVGPDLLLGIESALAGEDARGLIELRLGF